MPKVYSRRKDAEPAPEGAVYVGRGTVWGNPYVIGKDGDREQVIAKYKAACKPAFYERVRRELGGKDLVCWCAPLPCHADFLLKIANDERETQAADLLSALKVAAYHMEEIADGLRDGEMSAEDAAALLSSQVRQVQWALDADAVVRGTP